MTRYRSRQGLTLVLAVVAFLWLMALNAVSASAGEVSSSAGFASFDDATASEVNTLTIAQDVDGNIVFTDTTTPPTDIGGCTVVGDTATCLPANFISVRAGEGADTVTIDSSITSASVVEVDGGEGDDILNGGSGADSLTGGPGGDTIGGNAGSDVIDGGVGSDVITGGTGEDNLNGGTGAGDTLQGGDGNDNLRDGDQEAGQAGPGAPSTVDADALGGDAGRDSVDYETRTTSIIVDLSSPDTDTGNAGAPGENDDVDGMEDVTSGTGNDTLTGNTTDNGLVSNLGDDVLNGGDGSDSLDAGGFIVPGSSATDVDTANGGAGNDSVSGGNGVDAVTGGTGDDTVDGDSGADTVSGGDDSDVVSGGSGDDTSNGDAGDDIVNGGDGVDIVNGGAGDDTLTQDDQEPSGTAPGTLDGDTFSGGDGNDDVLYGDRLLGITVTANDNLANDGRTGASENDNVQSTVENIIGGNGADNLTGTDGANELLGGNGADSLSGLGGSDGLFGGIGNDTVNGGAGRDELRGERGDDTLQSQDSETDQVGCGAGTDTVTNDAVDRVEGDCETVAVPPTGGTQGPPGPAGPPGGQGSPGVTGPQGPAGSLPKITVTCKLTGKRKKKIKCTVKVKSAQARATVRMRLSRRGGVVAKGRSRMRHGKSTVVSLRLRKPARAGRYTLTTVIPAPGKAMTISQRFVVR